MEAIQGFSQPTTKKQVRAFLGITGYYRKFIPHYLTLAAPLRDLTTDQQKLLGPQSVCDNSYFQCQKFSKLFVRFVMLLVTPAKFDLIIAHYLQK